VPVTQPTANRHPTNGHAQANDGAAGLPIAAFRAYMQRERPTLVATLMREILANIPMFPAQSPELHAEITNKTVAAYIDALDDSSRMAVWAEQGLRPLVEQGLGLDPLFAIIGLYEHELISLSLRALEEGIPGAADGLRALIQASNISTRVVVQVFHERMQLFQTLAENAPDAIGVARLDGPLIYTNPALVQQIGVSAANGATFYDAFAEERDDVTELAQLVLKQGAWQGVRRWRRAAGGEFPGQFSGFVICDADGNPQALAAIIRDVSEQQRAEQDRIVLQEQVIQAQQAALRELSTPLIPLADGLVAMPLVGTIDSRRAQQIVDELLQGVSDNRATTAIIDITGVPVVDTHVAGALLRAAQAVELLGARVVLTGIRPEVAQTLVGIGVNLGSMVTRGTLQDGISYALRARSMR
jgi:PAS domain S-box-containing protein